MINHNQDSNPMELPKGKTCSDCMHFEKTCSWLISCSPNERSCDWLPIRFKEKRLE